MAHVLVVAGPLEHDGTDVLLTERVAPELLSSAHYSEQLLERLRWAVEDAAQVEDRERELSSAS